MRHTGVFLAALPWAATAAGMWAAAPASTAATDATGDEDTVFTAAARAVAARGVVASALAASTKGVQVTPDKN